MAKRENMDIPTSAIYPGSPHETDYKHVKEFAFYK